jgi:hypothetical protein
VIATPAAKIPAMSRMPTIGIQNAMRFRTSTITAAMSASRPTSSGPIIATIMPVAMRS